MVHRYIPQHHMAAAAAALVDVGPDSVLNGRRSVAAITRGAVQPVELRLQLAHNAVELGLKGFHIDGVGVVVRNMTRGRTEVVQNRLASAELRARGNLDTCWWPGAHHGRHARHTAAAEG